MKEKEKTKTMEKGIYLGKGLVLAFIITIVLILLFSLLLTYSTIKEERTALLNTIVMMASIAAGSIYVVTKVKENGWINGGILGITYYLILVLLNLIFFKSIQFDLFSVTRLATTSITGVISGIIGINITA